MPSSRGTTAVALRRLSTGKRPVAAPTRAGPGSTRPSWSVPSGRRSGWRSRPSCSITAPSGLRRTESSPPRRRPHERDASSPSTNSRWALPGGAEEGGGTDISRTYRRAVRGASVLVAMDRAGRERRQADRDVLGAAGGGRRVAHPLAGTHEHGLTGAHVERLFPVLLDPQDALDHDRVLVEVRPLTRLEPALGRTHVGDADALLARVDATDVLVDQLRLGARRLDARRALDQLGHARQSGTPRMTSASSRAS